MIVSYKWSHTSEGKEKESNDYKFVFKGEVYLKKNSIYLHEYWNQITDYLSKHAFLT